MAFYASAMKTSFARLLWLGNNTHFYRNPIMTLPHLYPLNLEYMFNSPVNAAISVTGPIYLRPAENYPLVRHAFLRCFGSHSDTDED